MPLRSAGGLERYVRGLLLSVNLLSTLYVLLQNQNGASRPTKMIANVLALWQQNRNSRFPPLSEKFKTTMIWFFLQSAR